jgi:hypothetical protein
LGKGKPMTDNEDREDDDRHGHSIEEFVCYWSPGKSPAWSDELQEDLEMLLGSGGAFREADLEAAFQAGCDYDRKQRPDGGVYQAFWRWYEKYERQIVSPPSAQEPPSIVDEILACQFCGQFPCPKHSDPKPPPLKEE